MPVFTGIGDEYCQEKISVFQAGHNTRHSVTGMMEQNRKYVWKGWVSSMPFLPLSLRL